MSVRDTLMNMVRSRGHEPALDEDLTQLLDSFELFSFILEIEQAFGVSLPPEELAKSPKTIDAFAGLIDAHDSHTG